MTNFMDWLYSNYIKPRLEDADDANYEMSLAILDASLDADQKAQYQRALEFYSINAFALGLRTGAGLSNMLKD